MISLKRLVVPKVLAAVVLREEDSTSFFTCGCHLAEVIIRFRGVEKVKEPVIIWQSEEAAKKHGAVDPVLPDKLGEVIENKAYVEVVEGLLETNGLEYLKMEGGELKFDCTMLSPYEQNILLRRLVVSLERISHLMAELFGWDCPPACIGRGVWRGLDCDLVDGGENGTGWVYPPQPSWFEGKRPEFKDEPFLSLVSYSIAYVGSVFSHKVRKTIPVLRCSAIYREEVNRVLGIDDDEDMRDDFRDRA